MFLSVTVNKRSIIYFICFLLIACTRNFSGKINNEIISFEKFPITDTLFFNTLSEYQKGIPNGIFVIDSTLIIFNNRKKSNFFFYNYSLSQNRFSEGYLRKGKGPIESIGAFSAGIINDSLWVHDITKMKIFKLSLAETFDYSVLPSINTYDIDKNFYKMCFIDDENFWGVGNLESCYKISSGDITHPGKFSHFGKFAKIPKRTPLESFKDAYSCYIYAKPDGGNVVLAYRYTDVIEIFDVKGEINKTIKGPIGFDAEFDVEEAPGYYYMGKNEKTRKAFVNGTVSNKFIYMLYSGYLRNEKNWSYGQSIYVYDWDGNPVKKIILDRPVYSIGISEDDRKLYSFDLQTGYLIYANIQPKIQEKDN